MRLVFVNYAHPKLAHISGVRLWRFAWELAQRGHQIVHITSTIDDAEAVLDPPALPGRLRPHDWVKPFHLPVRPVERRLLALARQGTIPNAARRAITAHALVVRGGVFYDWTDSVKRYLPFLIQAFRPQATWGTFGNLSNLYLARMVARSSGAAFVADVKDSFSSFMPKGTRFAAAWQLHNAAAISANSQARARDAVRLSPLRPEVLYSGVDEAFLIARRARPRPLKRRESFVITLTGSIYSRDRLREFLTGLRHWEIVSKARGERRVELRYAGADSVLAAMEIDAAGFSARAVVDGYLPIADLAALCASADANCYIWHRVTFHHKLLELLSLGCPVVAFGGEFDEARELARTMRGPLSCPTNTSELLKVFDGIASAPARNQCESEVASSHGWPAMAALLEKVFERVIEEQR